MSSLQSTIDRVQGLKSEVLDLLNAPGLAGEGWPKDDLLGAAYRLEAVAARLAARAGRPRGTVFTPPARPEGEPDFRERQLPRGDR